MGFEYYALNHFVGYSFLYYLKNNYGFFTSIELTTNAGRPVSYFLGIAGFGLILVTNFYIVRKRFSIFNKWGKLFNWLNFHIFCGMMGPILILFHTDMKFGGVVALSFWSMAIVAISGVLGRYFYMQVLSQKSELVKYLEKIESRMMGLIKKSYAEEDVDKAMAKQKAYIRKFTGIHSTGMDLSLFKIVLIFLKSFIVDIKLLFTHPQSLSKVSKKMEIYLYHYVKTEKSITFYGPFQKLLSHWHSFHIPFAIIMYVVAAIHIAVATFFSVGF